MSGNTYEIELRELLSICPRQRRRADAYYLLKKLLKDQYNVELVITSRTSKTNANHEKYDYAGAFVLSKDTDGIRIDIAPVILDEFGDPYVLSNPAAPSGAVFFVGLISKIYTTIIFGQDTIERTARPIPIRIAG